MKAVHAFIFIQNACERLRHDSQATVASLQNAFPNSLLFLSLENYFLSKKLLNRDFCRLSFWTALFQWTLPSYWVRNLSHVCLKRPTFVMKSVVIKHNDHWGKKRWGVQLFWVKWECGPRTSLSLILNGASLWSSDWGLRWEVPEGSKPPRCSSYGEPTGCYQLEQSASDHHRVHRETSYDCLFPRWGCGRLWCKIEIMLQLDNTGERCGPESRLWWLATWLYGK